MKALLTAVKNRLQADLSYIRPRDIFITPSLNLIPGSARPPCIGIKDGGIRRRELSAGLIESSLRVRIAIFVELRKDEAVIMGDDGAGQKGVLEIAADVHTALDAELLSIDGMVEAFSPSENESEMFGDENAAVQRKIIDYDYVKEGGRP